jgi:hypothetical protein
VSTLASLFRAEFSSQVTEKEAAAHNLKDIHSIIKYYRYPIHNAKSEKY